MKTDRGHTAPVGLIVPVMLLLLTSGNSKGAELKTPDVPFPEMEIAVGTQKALSVIGKDGVRIGGKGLRVSDGYAFTRFSDKGQELFSLNGRIDPAPKWAPFERFDTAFDEGQQVISQECPFDMADGKQGVFREQVKLTPEGKVTMTFQFDMPDDVKEKPGQVLVIKVPTAFLLGKKIKVDDHETIQLPEDVEEFVKMKFPERGGGLGDDHTLFTGPRKLFLAVDDPKNAFSLELSQEFSHIGIHKGRTDTQIGLGFKKPYGKPFSITLDPGNCFEVAQTDCVVGGVNYTQNNAFEAVVFDEQRNLFMNPSFESGTRYWKVSDEHGNIDKMLCSTDAFSGKHCMNIRNDTGFGPAVLKSVATLVYPDTEYTISAWIKSDDGKRAGMNIHPRGTGGSVNWSEAGGVETREPHDQWQRVKHTFTTSPGVHNLVIWISSTGTNLLVDSFQLEQGGEMNAYVGNKIGMELLTDSSDNPIVDENAPINTRLVVRAESGQTGSVDIAVSDFFGRTLLEKTERFSVGESGEQAIPFGPDSLFPKGTTIVKVVVHAEGQKTYHDFMRLIRIAYADNTAKHKTLQSSGPYLRGSFSRLPDNRARLYKYFGIGALAYTAKLEGRETEAEHAVMGKHGIVDFWGGVLWNVNWRAMINGQNWKWNGVPVQQMESYPPEFLKWAEAMAYEQTKASPWIGYWSMPTEPMGVYMTLRNGNQKEYAKMILAINRGVMRANPEALFCPFGVWNLYAQGRNDIFHFLRSATELEPDTKFKVIDCHTYRPFPENPDVEEDLMAFIKGLAEIGYPDIKIKLGEGSYYFPMIAPEFDVAPWAGVGPKDGYFDIAIPSYDLGWGERIGAAQVTRETLVYYKHADRVINNCSWCPPFIDNTTPISWWTANSALIDILGNADFKEDIRFASYSRAYLFEDQNKRTVAAVWKFDEKFDRGLTGGTTMAMTFEDGVKPEFIDLMGNVCEVPILDGTYQVPLSGFPVYIRVAKGQGSALSKAIAQCDVAADDKSLPLKFSATIQTRTTAAVKVINPLSRPLVAEIGIAGDARKRVEAKPTSTETVMVDLPKPVSDSGFDGIDIPIRAHFKGREYNEDFKAVALAVHYVEEGFSWNDVPVVKVPHLHVTAKNHKPNGKADLGANCQFAWNEKSLYMRFEVDDDKFVCPEKGTPWGSYWNYDSIQLFFDSFSDAREKAKNGITGFDSNDFSYELLPDSTESAVVFRRIAPDIQLTGGAMHAFEANVLEGIVVCNFKYENGKRVYDVIFPMRSLMPIPLEDGASFGFGFEIYDRDEAKIGAPQKLSNVPTTDACGNPHLYPQLILVKRYRDAQEDAM